MARFWKRRRVHRIARGDLITLTGWWREIDVVRIQSIQVNWDHTGNRISIDCGPDQPYLRNVPDQPRRSCRWPNVRRLPAALWRLRVSVAWAFCGVMLLDNVVLHPTIEIVAATAVPAALLVAWVVWLNRMAHGPKTLRPGEPAEPIIGCDDPAEQEEQPHA